MREYHEKVQYIHLNPVKAGLVNRAEDWPWSSVHDYAGNVSQAPATTSALAINRVLLPADERRSIRDFCGPQRKAAEERKLRVRLRYTRS